jgi:hypothetical protein
MIDSCATVDDNVTLADTLPPVAMLLGGVPVLTLLVMTAVRYVASGTI